MSRNEQVSAKRAARGALFLYISFMVGAMFRYLYWVIVSKMVTPEAVGLASTTISIVTLASSLAILGVPTGVQRFLGKALRNSDGLSFKSYFRDAMTLLILSCGIAALILTSGFLGSYMAIGGAFVLIAAIMTFTTGLTTLFGAAYTATLRTDITLYGGIIASAARFILGALLILAGWEALGVTVGYLVSNVVLLAFLAILSASVMGLGAPRLRFLHVKEIVRAGVAGWLPKVIATVGTQLSVVVVCGFRGSFEAGLYYISFAMASALSAISTSILGLSFPILSGMTDGRKRACWRAIKMTLALTIPLAAALAAYPEVALGLFSSEYAAASGVLIVLLFAIVPQALVDGVSFLAYAYGKYGWVLVIGLAVSASRTIAYVILTPLIGGLGAAFAFLAGTFIGLAATLGVARSIGFRLQWQDLIVAVLPLVTIAVCRIPIPWFLGVTIVLAVSTLTYTRLGLVTKSDMMESLRAFAPRRLLSIELRRFDWIIRVLFGKQHLP